MSSSTQLLVDLPTLVPLERIDQIWLFPPRVSGEVESGLVVLTLSQAGSDQREVVTVRYEARARPAAMRRQVSAHGWAPAERVPGVIAGVLRRLGEGEAEPRHASIGGDADNWNRFLGEVSEEP